MDLVTLPPYTVLFVRGDVVHCGRGKKDKGEVSANEERTLRYHLHLVLEKKELPNGIHLVPEFKPRFKEQDIDN